MCCTSFHVVQFGLDRLELRVEGSLRRFELVDAVLRILKAVLITAMLTGSGLSLSKRRYREECGEYKASGN